MITVYVRCSDGREGDWMFDTLPRIGEQVVLQQPLGRYEVVRIEHFPRLSGDAGDGKGVGVALRLLQVDPEADPVWGEDRRPINRQMALRRAGRASGRSRRTGR